MLSQQILDFQLAKKKGLLKESNLKRKSKKVYIEIVRAKTIVIVDLVIAIPITAISIVTVVLTIMIIPITSMEELILLTLIIQKQVMSIIELSSKMN